MLLTQPNRYTVSHRTIKNNELFLVDDLQGNITENNDSGLGLYRLDTRYLSCLEITMNGREPVSLLSSTEQGYFSTLVYTNGQMETRNENDERCTVLEETIQLKRESIIDGALFEKYTLISYHIEPVWISIAIRVDADFRDMFEIRHLLPYQKRTIQGPILEDNALIFSYQQGTRLLETRVVFQDEQPRIVNGNTIVFEKLLNPLEQYLFNLEIQLIEKPTDLLPFAVSNFTQAVEDVTSYNHAWKGEVTEFTSDNDDFNEMMARSNMDMRMLMTQTENGAKFIAAGIPWYVCLFGRDSIITAREALILNPEMAKWTLNILAQYQGTQYDPGRDEEPGKILHELRTGELARLKKIPHTPYYGSVDSTPLWLILLYDYFLWTKDYETLKALWPNALSAMAWIDTKIAETPWGYVNYLTHAPQGLGIVHQGWKDSSNSAMYDNGLQAEPPIALVEVQGYVYLAKRRMSQLAELMGDKEMRRRLRDECKAFRARFNRDFWIDSMGFCALGLDSQGHPLKVISSNPGHCLETGILPVPAARKIANRLMAPDMFSGWGIRTLSSEMIAFNPMSYHNGSVWPHDNAVIAKGMSDIGQPELSEQIFSGLFEAARLMSYKRLPELFCGFPRDIAKSDPPVRYPVACSPQAWAAASFFSLTQSMLSLVPDLQNGSLHIKQPKMPYWMSYLRLKNLKVGSVVLDLEFRKTNNTVIVDVLKRSGKLDIMIKI